MRKKILMLLLAAGLGVLLTACGGSDGEVAENPQAAEQNPLVGTCLPEFSVATLDGGTADEMLLLENELTMFNIWGSFCGPCIAEMPDLARLAQDLPSQGINVVGILVDDDTATAQQILADAGADFVNIIPDENLQAVIGRYQYVPTTIFVDAKGEIMGEIAIGSMGYDAYKALALTALNSARQLNNPSGG